MFLSTIFENRKHYLRKSPLSFEDIQQGMFLKKMKPIIQTNIFKSSEVIANYFEMQDSGIWLGQEQLITQADFYFPDKKLAIFCDGKQFHNIEKDKRINAELDKIDIKVLRFTGKEITENLEKVLEIIKNEYEK